MFFYILYMDLHFLIMEAGENMAVYRENKEFRILSAIGIILVAAGHLVYNIFEIGELFPYYSFHVFIFLFVSGYFYKKESRDRIGSYLAGKCLTLLGPYFAWNLFYGIITELLHRAGFFIGQPLSLKTMFLSPFLDGHQFLYNFPAWFVPVLFMLEVINVLMRKVLSMIYLENEWLIFGWCLLAGVLTVWLAAGGHVWGWYKIPGRLLFMLPGFQLGRLYREKLEKYDTLGDGLYFACVMGVQVLIVIFCAGLNFSAVWVSSFANGPIIPYLTVVTGIAFWLRIARIMSKIPYVSGKMVWIGRNTYSIMMHHVFCFMLVKGFFYLCSLYTPFCADFDREMFFCEINFVFLPGGAEASKWIYLAAGVGLPLGMAELWRWIRDFKKRKEKR